MKNNGFTLIELVVVIVILGILAATAAPKFMDLKSDAVHASLLGLKGNLASAINISHAKMVMYQNTSVGDNSQGGDCDINPKNPGCIEIAKGLNVRVKSGYPDRSEIYKIVDADILVHSVYNIPTRCDQLPEAQLTCEGHDYCFCGLGGGSGIGDIRSSLHVEKPNNIKVSDISVFWPRGYTIEKSLKRKGQCYMVYVQPAKADSGSPIYNSAGVLQIFNDGC